ncbi:hypothetical protein TNCV_5053021 [Trichonephila clavipes]|nr:hypothetical protein TNCV_5053021 [Trichonephila clavipes]
MSGIAKRWMSLAIQEGGADGVTTVGSCSLLLFLMIENARASGRMHPAQNTSDDVQRERQLPLKSPDPSPGLSIFIDGHWCHCCSGYTVSFGV